MEESEDIDSRDSSRETRAEARVDSVGGSRNNMGNDIAGKGGRAENNVVMVRTPTRADISVSE